MKLGDGTWLLGDHATGPAVDFNEADVSIVDQHWLALDIDRVVTAGNWVEHPDLRRLAPPSPVT